MNEYGIVYQSFGGLIGLSIGCLFYSLGGRSGKWKRRFIGSFIIASTFNILCALQGIWQPLLLLSYPMLVGTFCLPYGADTTFPKVIKRTTIVLASFFIGLCFCLLNGGNAWLLLILHFGVSIWSVLLGVKNPMYAAAEETFICCLLCLPLIMYPFTTFF